MKPPEPSRDQLLAMAYADGELSKDERAGFEARLAAEPSLAREVAEYRAIELIAREMAPPEPADHEWARLEFDPLHRAGNQFGTFLLGGGALGLAVWGVYEIARGDLELFPKVCSLALVVGFATLLLATVQGRLRLLPLDPYRKVQR